MILLVHVDWFGFSYMSTNNAERTGSSLIQGS